VISDREIARMRRVQEQFMPMTCTVKRPVKTKNAAGQSDLVYTDVYVDEPCEVTAKVLRQIIEHIGGGTIQSAVRWNIVMRAGLVIELDDRIFVNTDAGVEVYEVNGDQSTESYETATVAQCLKVG
jgi:hypothetical protein